MNSEKTVSVIIPHYNSPEKLERMLESIDLKEDDVQVIVVDDRSDKDTDKLSDIRRRYSKKVEFYRNNKGKKGAGTARNIGLRHAMGKWLLFADADDYFTDGAWETIRDACENSDAEVIYFSPTSVIEGTSEESDRHKYLAEMVREYADKGDRESELALRSGFDSPVSKLIRRELVEENGIRFDETPIANDVMFSVKTGITAKKTEGQTKPIYCITKEKTSLSYKNDREFIDCRMNVALNNLKYLRSNTDKGELKLSGSRYFRAAVGKGYRKTDMFRWMVIFAVNGFKPFEIKYLPEIVSGLLKRDFEFMRRDDWKIWKAQKDC